MRKEETMNATTTLQPKTMLIGRKHLAELSGLRDSTLKFYSEQGLLPYHQAGAGLARRYDRSTAAARLQEIEALQTLGLSIEQIKNRLIPA
jgi:DNA-binding transcriptional MerR regulator